MNTTEKIEAALKKKEEGNVLFKAGKYARASKRYEKVYGVYGMRNVSKDPKQFTLFNVLFCVMPPTNIIFHLCRLWSTLSTILPLVMRRKSRPRQWRLLAIWIMQLASWS
jgi:hypothetical protein